MNDIVHNYYYKKITKKSQFNMLQTKNNPLKKIITPEIAENIQNNEEYETYVILYDYEIIGFFTIKEEYQEFNQKKSKILKIECIYIYKMYRYDGLGREIINDILWSIKDRNISYILANSYVDSCMFFLKNGFDFCQNLKNEKLEKNIIIMYKKIK